MAVRSEGPTPLLRYLGTKLYCPWTPEGVERFDVAAIGQRGKAGNPDVDTDDASGRMHRLRNLALSLDAHKPLTAAGRHGDVFGCAEDIPAVAIANPAEFRQEDAAVGLIELEPLGEAKAIR